MNLLYQNKLLVAFVLFFAYTTIMHAQLSIKKHTKVHIDKIFTSLESKNVIHSDVKGKGDLIFNSAHEQELTTGYLTQLPNVIIKNSKSFHFNTPIQIDGDLSLHASSVTVKLPIYLKGNLQVDDHTKIFGIENIQFKTQIQPQPIPFTNQHQTTDITLGVEHLKNANTLTNQHSNKTKYHYKNIASYLLAVKIPKPPI